MEQVTRFIPIESSRQSVARIAGQGRLIEIEGAHGIAVHGDPQYLDRQTLSWLAQAIADIARWVA